MEHINDSYEIERYVESMELHFTRTNGPVDEAINHLFELCGDIHHPGIVREMILAALKAGQENTERINLKIINTTLKEMRFTAKVFNPYREVRKVTTFGSARTKPDEPIFQMARDLGHRLSAVGYMVITGGGPGIMQAVNEGAGAESSFGVNIRLPFEQEINPVIMGNPRSITYKYFFNRKIAFLKESDAVILFPGGFGTLDEALESLTLVQTGKRAPLPILLIDTPQGTYWKQWLNFIENELVNRSYIKSTDLSLFEIVVSVDEAVERISRFYRRYHSLRYIGEKLVIRLNSEVEPEKVRSLKALFGDILTLQGDLVLTGAVEEELDEIKIAHLPRIVVDFNRKDFGRLRNLIDAINAF